METAIFDSDYPTQVTEHYWVYASAHANIQHPRKYKQIKSGKWLIFSDIKDHDSVWQKVKRATQKGILGVGAKAATAVPNPTAICEDEKVICVYTYNWLDVKDVYRVEKALRKIGIEQTLYYKSDTDTLAGQYKVNGSKNISKYVSKSTKSYKRFALHSLHGIGDDKVKILHRIGIKNFDDLLSFDTSRKLTGVGISTPRINKLKLSALAQIEEQIYRLTPFEFPTGEIIHFDIETDLSYSYTTKRVWSIAIFYKNKVKHFFAKSWRSEKTILRQFLMYIKKIDNPLLFSYSGVGFDKNILSAALKRHDLDFEYFLNCTHYDLCTVIRQNYVLPIGAYGLKQIGKFFGYKFKHEHLDGLYVAMQYLHCQRTGKKLPQSIFSYIEDDVKSMDFILTQLLTRKDIKHLI